MGFFVSFRKLFQHTDYRGKRASGIPRGLPPRKKVKKRKKDFHKKAVFSVRIDKRLADNFRALCVSRGIYVNEIIEIFMRDTLYKDSVERVRSRVIKARAREEKQGRRGQTYT